MTLFEYISVAFSIVLSLAAIRLLGGLSVCLSPERRYGPHVAWVLLLLLNCAFVWWNFWSFRVVDWNLLKFLSALLPPGLMYLMAAALVPDNPASVESWREHFYRARVRYFTAFAGFMVAVTLNSWLLVGLHILNPARAIQVSALGLTLSGALSDSRRLHVLLPGVFLVLFALAMLLYTAPGSITPRP